MLELTTRFEGITTGARQGRRRLSGKQAAQKAIANLRYIARPSAVKPGDTIALNLGAEGDLKGLQHIMRDAVRRRAEKGGKKGIRVAEKMMCSLPNDFAGDPAREAVHLIAKRLAAGSSDVKVYAVIHTDRPNNLHAHFLVIDGLETRAQALRRVGQGAQRVRPRSVIRLNERGRPKELRNLFACAINEIAETRGLTKVESRSFKERGKGHNPGKHIGAWKSQVQNRELHKLLNGVILDPISSFDLEAEELENDDLVQELLHNLTRTVRRSRRHRGRERI